MGVPAFFRWLTRRYPSVVSSSPPRSGVDCLYLDLNGVIHPAVVARDTEEEMFAAGALGG